MGVLCMRYSNRNTKDSRGIHDGFGEAQNAAGFNRMYPQVMLVLEAAP